MRGDNKMPQTDKQLPPEVYEAISGIIQFLEKTETKYLERQPATAHAVRPIKEDKNENS
ncbi:MAG: hypothetical protein FWE21_08695 [Defluviitaleaceae bacterium]|nr:hypothetical protein [Defluviitaleaceae bacterium]